MSETNETSQTTDAREEAPTEETAEKTAGPSAAPPRNERSPKPKERGSREQNGNAASGEKETADLPKFVPKDLPAGQHWWWGTGRRKTAVARVRIRPGSGEFRINNRDLDVFFTEERDRKDIRTVLEKTNTRGNLDVRVKVHGGGFMGQAGAIVLGLGRALQDYDDNLESILRDNGFLTRDAREVERKKYGQRGARRRFQFSKR